VAKPIVQIGLSVVVDRRGKGPKQLVSVGAALGEKEIQVNFRPQHLYNGFNLDAENTFFHKYPDRWPALLKNQESLANGLTKFNLWLKQFQGRLVAVTQSLEFYQLYSQMMENIGECEFIIQPLDLKSWLAGLRGTAEWPQTIPLDRMRQDKVGVLPVEVAKDRWFAVSRGVMPRFGEVKKKKVGESPLRFLEAEPSVWAAPERPRLGGFAQRAILGE
jgi:hypothetical protein